MEANILELAADYIKGAGGQPMHLIKDISDNYMGARGARQFQGERELEDCLVRARVYSHRHPGKLPLSTRPSLTQNIAVLQMKCDSHRCPDKLPLEYLTPAPAVQSREGM